MNKIRFFFSETLTRIFPKQMSLLLSIKYVLESNKPYSSYEEPELYNCNGEKMHSFFLYATMINDSSATCGRNPKYIHWDRGNYRLDTHFYVLCNTFPHYQIGNPKRKFALIIEPKSCHQKTFQYWYDHLELFEEYEAVFTHDDYLLKHLPNARLMIWGGVYYGNKYGGGEIDPFGYLLKERNISLVSSYKDSCSLQRLRLELAKYYENNPKVDCYGTFRDVSGWVKANDYLKQYRYHIVVENEVSEYWMTEKLMNCFAAMVVPIYIGATRVGEIFNADGIIQISPDNAREEIDAVLEQCNERDYLNRLEAIKDNFERVKKFLCFEDWLYDEYKDLFNGL